MTPIKALFNKVSKLKDREKGRRAFILANGPSVASEDLSFLKDELVIGMNASTMLEERHNFVTDYYVVSDSRFLNHPEKRHWATTGLNNNTVRVLRADIEKYDDYSLSSRTFYVRPLSRDGFSSNLTAGYFYGCSTTMLALQLSFHLGCRDVFLLGCDLRYREESPRFYNEAEPQLEDGFTGVQILNIANAGIFFESNGGSLTSCSENSLLRPYVPYISFPEAIGVKLHLMAKTSLSTEKQLTELSLG